MKGYKLAHHLYTAAESKEWLRWEHDRSADPLIFYDAASQHFKNVMEALSVQPRKVMINILLSYRKGITCKELSANTGYTQPAVSSILGRLRKAGLIQKAQDKARSPYIVPDDDFLGVCATRWDSRWQRGTDVHEFIEQQSSD